MMKKMCVVAIAMAFLGASGGAFAEQDAWWRGADTSWWGNTGALPEPVKDEVHPGYWWWPMDPDPSDDDTDMWGNRGCIYNMWEPMVEEPPMTPQAPQDPPTDIRRSVPIFNHVLFDFDRYNLKPEGVVEVNNVVNILKQYPGDVLTVEGHTDSVGTDQYNMGLGQRRADSIKNHMVQNGISSGRISTVSYGESRPAVPNDSPANRALNRRGIFVYTINE